jgi:hypothetical protein
VPAYVTERDGLEPLVVVWCHFETLRNVTNCDGPSTNQLFASEGRT